MDTKTTIKTLINDSIDAKKRMLDDVQIDYIDNVIEKIVDTYRNKRKTIVCGNGGSASDALHFSAEMVVRFEKNRVALPSLTLNENLSSLTAIGNDCGYDYSFSRQLEAFAQEGDTLMALSTSGNSKNIINALEFAKKLGIFTIGMTNSNGGKMKSMCDLCYCAPTKVTARTQECHILLIHIIAKLVEEKVSNCLHHQCC
jgi:D-sedoheptulose 7-phosphate isomerase